jgi:hypothetical protein
MLEALEVWSLNRLRMHTAEVILAKFFIASKLFLKPIRCEYFNRVRNVGDLFPSKFTILDYVP